MQSKLFIGAMMALGAVAAPVLDVIDVIETVTITLPYGQSAPTPAPVPAPAAVPAPKVAPAPAPAPAQGLGFLQHGGSDNNNNNYGGDHSGSGSGYEQYILGIANNWRLKYKLHPLKYDNTMQPNCEDVGQGGGGKNEIHHLIANKPMGQVITPGPNNTISNPQNYEPFELAYLAWLCEKPSDAELQPAENNGCDVCAVVQEVLHMEYSDTGHHDILCNPDYTTIACAFTENPESGGVGPYQGLWVCDLSY